MNIHEFTQRYFLPRDQKAALDSLLCGFKEKRFKIGELEVQAKNRLTNAIVCRGTSLEHFDLFLDNVLSHFNIATKEGVLNVNRYARMGHRR